MNFERMAALTICPTCHQFSGHACTNRRGIAVATHEARYDKAISDLEEHTFLLNLANDRDDERIRSESKALLVFALILISPIALALLYGFTR